MNNNDIMNEVCKCFKMNVDLNGLSKLEDYINNLQKKSERQSEVIKSLRGNIKSISKTAKNRKDEIKRLLEQIDRYKKVTKFDSEIIVKYQTFLTNLKRSFKQYRETETCIKVDDFLSRLDEIEKDVLHDW